MSTTAVRPVLREGSLAYFDSLQGPIPCKVRTISGVSGAPGSAQWVTVVLTANRGPWKRGETQTGFGHRFIPRGALKQRRYGARITYYTVEVPS